MNRFAFAAVAALAAAPLSAHETLMVPHAMTGAAGDEIRFDILSTHVMFAAEELENIEIVSAHVVAGGETADVAIHAADAETHIEGVAVAPSDAPFFLVAHRHGVVWSQTPDGWKRGGRDANPDARMAGKYERFSKALINASVEADADVWGAPLGHVLEIVPLDNPAALSAGEEMRVRVLHNGEPISATVQATFAGFSDAEETYAYVTQTFMDDEHGAIARVKPWTDGVWVARVEHRAPGEADFDQHVLRATLVFAVE